MEITISGRDRKHLKQVEELAKKLGLKISRTKEKNQTIKKGRQKKALNAMENLVRIGAFKDINDPVAWQRNQRKDRHIGRNG